MGVDYYNILKVSRTAGEEELRRSYKKLAMRWHPDKHPSSSKQVAESKFKQICEAYDVLSDAQKRQIYDQYGEEALKSGQFSDMSSPSAPRRSGSEYGSLKESAFKYNPRAPDDIFAEFFSEGGARLDRNWTAIKAPPLEMLLSCTLEELYTGSKRKMKISRIVPDQAGQPTPVEEVLGIEVKPGWKRGTKITFPEKGNQETGRVPGDLIFVIDEKPHSVFKRDGNDLVVNQKISLLNALIGKRLSFTALDGRNINIMVSEVVRPGHEIVIQNEGMPISKDPMKKGNLRIKFDVSFPSRLTSEQKSDLRRVLGGT